MSNCPFCSQEISEELSLYGGHCPNCLIEIPGEEAVTDPGVGAGAAQPASSTPKRSYAPMVLVAIGLVAGAGWWVSQSHSGSGASRSHGVRPSVPLSAHQDQEYQEEVSEEPVVSSSQKPRRTRRNAKGVDRSAPERTTQKQDAAPADSVSMGLGDAPADMFSAIGAAPRTRGGPQGIVLEDSAKIEAMVARVLTRGAREIEGCFAPVKRANPGATGAWYVGFTVSKEGRAVGVGIEPLGTPNTGIEACIQSVVAGWRFQRVSESVLASDTYRMGG